MTTDAELRQRLGQGALRTARQYDAGALAERWIGIFSEARARRANQGRLTTAAQEGSRYARRSSLAAGYSTNELVTPAQARHEALGSAVAAARATGADWLVIPPHEGDTTIVVLPMTARDAFLTALVEAQPPAYLSLRDPALNGWHERRGTIADLGTDLRRGMTTAVCIEPWPVVDDRPSLLGQGCTVEVEFWERSVQGDLVGPAPQPVRRPDARGAGHRRGGGRGRQGPDAAADGDAHRGRGQVPRRRRLHLGRRQRPGLERRARAAAGRRHRHCPEPGVQRPGPVHRARRAALLLPQHPPLRAVGTPDPPGHRRSGPRLAGHRPPDGQPRRPRADPPGRRAADVQLPRDRDVPAPDRRAGRALRLLQRRLPARAAAAPGDAVHRVRPLCDVLLPDDDRAHRRAGRRAVPQGRVEQPGAPAGRVRRRDHPQPRARAVRPPRVGAAGAARALPRAAGRDRAVAVPQRHRRLDAELAGPALRAAHREGVHRRAQPHVRQPQQRRRGAASSPGSSTATRTSSAWPTTTTTP